MNKTEKTYIRNLNTDDDYRGLVIDCMTKNNFLETPERGEYLQRLSVEQLNVEREYLNNLKNWVNSRTAAEILEFKLVHVSEGLIPQKNIAGGRYQHRAMFVYEKGILPFIKENPDAKILNIGSGDGNSNFLYWIVEQNLPQDNCAAAVDMMPHMLLRHHVYDIDTYLLNIEKEDIKDFVSEKFDIIICSEFLEHVSQNAEDKILNFIKSNLRKNGSVLFTYPVGEHFKYDPSPFGHVRPPQPMAIRQQLSDYFERYEEGSFQNIKKYDHKWEMPKTPSFFQQFSGFSTLQEQDNNPEYISEWLK